MFCVLTFKNVGAIAGYGVAFQYFGVLCDKLNESCVFFRSVNFNKYKCRNVEIEFLEFKMALYSDINPRCSSLRMRSDTEGTER